MAFSHQLYVTLNGIQKPFNAVTHLHILFVGANRLRPIPPTTTTTFLFSNCIYDVAPPPQEATIANLFFLVVGQFCNRNSDRMLTHLRQQRQHINRRASTISAYPMKVTWGEASKACTLFSSSFHVQGQPPSLHSYLLPIWYSENAPIQYTHTETRGEGLCTGIVLTPPSQYPPVHP